VFYAIFSTNTLDDSEDGLITMDLYDSLSSYIAILANIRLL